MASHGIPRISGPLVKDDAAKQREVQEIKKYRDLVDQVNEKIKAHDYSLQTLTLTSTLLQKNPEYYTIWNHRRRILLHQFSQITAPSATPLSAAPAPPAGVPANTPQIRQHLTEDLQFLVPLLLQYPKCYWLWNHRLWLLEQGTERLPLELAKRLWQEELGLVNKMLHRDQRNFHGWGYRRRVIASLESLSIQEARESEKDQDSAGSKAIEPKSLVEQEFVYTTDKIKENLSNFSAWHNRSKLIVRLLNERQADSVARRKMLDAEFELAQNALIDPVDQSPWFYHQFLISNLSPACPESARIVLDLTNADRLRYLEQEITNIRDMLEDSADCKWVYQALLLYCEMYLELDGGNKFFTTLEMREWLERLRELDPLRRGKWGDWERRLGL